LRHPEAHRHVLEKGGVAVDQAASPVVVADAEVELIEARLEALAVQQHSAALGVEFDLAELLVRQTAHPYLEPPGAVAEHDVVRMGRQPAGHDGPPFGACFGPAGPSRPASR